MNGGGVIRGVVGIIKWQYYNAAAVNGYTVTRTPDNRWSLSCVVVNHDPFKMRQKPLVFEAPFKGGAWRWPITDLEMTDGRVTATLGPLMP